MGKGYIYRYLIIVRIMLDFGIICRNKFLSLCIFFLGNVKYVYVNVFIKILIFLYRWFNVLNDEFVDYELL